MTNNNSYIPKVPSGRPSAARVEYLACQEEVEAMLAKGYSVKMVYEAMKDQGRVTCSYSAFCDYVRGGGKRKHSKSKRLPGSVRTQNAAPPIIGGSSKRLVDPKTIDPKTLF